MSENTQTDAALVECFAVIDRLTADRDRWKADADRLDIAADGVLAEADRDTARFRAMREARRAHDALTAETETP